MNQKTTGCLCVSTGLVASGQRNNCVSDHRTDVSVHDGRFPMDSAHAQLEIESIFHGLIAVPLLTKGE